MGSSCTTPSGSRHLPISPSTKWRPRNGNSNGLPPRILTKLDQSGAAGQKMTGSPPTRHVISRPPARGASSRVASSNVISRMSSGWDDMWVVSLIDGQTAVVKLRVQTRRSNEQRTNGVAQRAAKFYGETLFGKLRLTQPLSLR